MAKLFNIVAFFIAEVLSISLIYLLYSPVKDLLNSLGNGFEVIATMIFGIMVIFGAIIGPILVLTDENLSQKLGIETEN